MTNFWLKNTNLQQNNERFLFYFQHKTLTKSAYKTTSKTNYIYTKLWQNQQIIQHQNQLYLYKTLTKSADKTTSINSCAKSSWYARRQHSYNICKDFLSHNSGMKNRNFTKKYTDRRTQFQWLCEVWSELAKGFPFYSATYEKSPAIWWINSINSGMKSRYFTTKYTDRQTINFVKFEVNGPRVSQFTAGHTKNPLQFDE